VAPNRARSLRTTVSVGIALVAALAAATAAALLILTAHLRAVTTEVAAGIESVRLVEEMEIELLLHARESDATLRSAHAGNLRRQLQEAARYVTTEDEGALLERAREAVASYLEGAQGPVAAPAALAQSLAGAFAATRALVDINVAQSQDALLRANEADRLARGVGLATIAFLLPIVAPLVWWLWRHALAPVFELALTMERFTAGNRSIRARETGPRELREMAERFNQMAAELSRQRASQMAFLGGVAHDIRNPLSAVKMSITVLCDRGVERSVEDTALLSRIALRQIDRLDRMVGDLLEVTRIEAGQLELVLADVDVARLAADVVALLEPTAPAHVFHLAMPETPAWVRGDAVRLEQVLGNLVGNAVKYSPRGGPVQVAVTPDADGVVVSVSDQGIGIPESEQAALFEPFRRATSAQASAIPGAGLGLFVARRIVEAHGGRLSLRSRPGEGSTFSVRLACAPRERTRADETVAEIVG
jgi:signal transduction histidine kinase